MLDVIPARYRGIVAGTGLLMLVLLAWGYLGDGDDRQWIELIVVLLVNVLLAYLLWRYFVAPRELEPGERTTAGVVVGVLAVLAALMYWTGLWFVLAPVAIALGTAGRGRGDATDAKAAVALGWLALVVATAVAILDLA